jgi:hypothetical protein
MAGPDPARIAEVRTANLALVQQVEASLADFWRRVDLSNPDRARNGLLNFVPLLVQRYGDMASTVAADWFEELRFEAIDEGYIARIAASTAHSFSPRLAPVDTAATEATVRYLAAGLYSDTPEAVLPRLQDAASRQVLQTGRATTRLNTFTRGSGARGWARATRPGSCRFCRAIAGRGAVFTERTARFASHAPKCNCVAYPSFDPNAPQVEAMAYVASRSTAQMSDEERAIHREKVTAWLERKFPGESDHDHADDEH